MQLVCWLQCRRVPKRVRRIVSGHVRGVLIRVGREGVRGRGVRLVCWLQCR